MKKIYRLIKVKQVLLIIYLRFYLKILNFLLATLSSRSGNSNLFKHWQNLSKSDESLLSFVLFKYYNAGWLEIGQESGLNEEEQGK